MSKELFDDAIGEAPPSTIDVDAAVVRGRRAARLSRVANPVVAAGVAVVLLVGVVAFTMTREGDDGMRAGTPPASTTAPRPPATSTGGVDVAEPGPPKHGHAPESCKRKDLETAGEVAARLTPVLVETFAAARPDVQFTPHPAAVYPEGVPHAALELFEVRPENDPTTPLPICDENSYVMARAVTHSADGTGSVLVSVAPSFEPEPAMQCTNEEPSGEVQDCKESTGPRGDHMTLTMSKLEGGSSTNRIDVVRPDGTSVTVIAENIESTGKSGGPPTSGQVVLNYDQLTAIATDPRMTLFP